MTSNNLPNDIALKFINAIELDPGFYAVFEEWYPRGGFYQCLFEELLYSMSTVTDTSDPNGNIYSKTGEYIGSYNWQKPVMQGGRWNITISYQRLGTSGSYTYNYWMTITEYAISSPMKTLTLPMTFWRSYGVRDMQNWLNLGLSQTDAEWLQYAFNMNSGKNYNFNSGDLIWWGGTTQSKIIYRCKSDGYFSYPSDVNHPNYSTIDMFAPAYSIKDKNTGTTM